MCKRIKYYLRQRIVKKDQEKYNNISTIQRDIVSVDITNRDVLDGRRSRHFI
jgi:hypothetical protein